LGNYLIVGAPLCNYDHSTLAEWIPFDLRASMMRCCVEY